MALPATLASIRDDFLSVDRPTQLEILLELSESLPEVPERYRDQIDKMERVEECQSPVYIVTELHPDHTVEVIAEAPPTAPTTRGFASILVQGLSGQTAEAILEVPSDYPLTLGLTEAVSPLRIRGMSGMLSRIQRQVREALSAASVS